MKKDASKWLSLAQPEKHLTHLPIIKMFAE